MMVSIFISERKSITELLKAVEGFRKEGYDADSVQLGVSWSEYLKTLPNNTSIVVYSVDFFPSLMELLSTLAELQERGITLKSLQEPWLSQNVGSTTDFLLKLGDLAVLLHKNRTQQGMQRAAAQGRHAGRPRKGV